MAREDPNGGSLVSCIVQDEVPAHFSGALVSQSDGSVVIEGVQGFGDHFMLGSATPEVLPARVEADVLALQQQAALKLGPVRMEWAHDGERAWVLQLHAGVSQGCGRTIVPGEPSSWRSFDVSLGLKELRRLVEQVAATQEGITLIGNIGITSHMADVLRRANVPSRIGAP